MSRITSTAEWFRAIGPTATLEERRAALAKLVRMLVGDSARPRPPISLPGRPAIPPPPPPVGPPTTPAGSPLRHYSAIGNFEPGDEQEGAWSTEQRLKMDRRFVERLERAIAQGKEQPHA
jgi:hypothetical protein